MLEYFLFDELCQCLLASQGDVDRQFLGPINFPASLLLRGCHPVPLPSSPPLHRPPVQSDAVESDKDTRSVSPFSITSVPLACGGVLDLRENESVEVHHICRPEERFKGQVSHVKMLSSAVLICEEVRQEFQACIKRIYEVATSLWNCDLAVLSLSALF